MRVITNFGGFPKSFTTGDGMRGDSIFVDSVPGFLEHSSNRDSVFVVNCDPKLTLGLASAQLFRPWQHRPPLVAVDLVLRRPGSVLAGSGVLMKRLLFRRVDLFIHYFRDVSGLEEVYGIGPDRSAFVPFKANLWGMQSTGAEPGGKYVLCFGRSLRDFDTFFTAMHGLPYEGAIVDPWRAKVWDHGSRFSRSLEQLPSNVRVIEHDLSPVSQAEAIRHAWLVVVPILKQTIVSAGISTILNAMLMGKCVVASAGPGVSDIFKGELLSVPPEEPAALAAMIRRAGEDEALRARMGTRAHSYVTECGDTVQFYQRIIECIASWRAGHSNDSCFRSDDT